MEAVFREIRNTRQVKGDIYFHDPFYDNGKRQFMKFARPVVNITTQWDSVTDQWETLETFEHDSIHIPSEFYDFYIDPKLVDSKVITEYKKILPENSHQYKILVLMEEESIDYFQAMLLYVYRVKFRIVKTLPHFRIHNIIDLLFPGIPVIFANQFSETWNTADYCSLFLPKREVHFVNIEKLECNCNQFKDFGSCDHIIKPAAERIIWNKFGNHDLIRYFKPSQDPVLGVFGVQLGTWNPG